MSKKIAERKLTKSGLLLIADDGCTCSLSSDKIDTLKSLGISIPTVGDTVNCTMSTDSVGNESAKWFDLSI